MKAHYPSRPVTGGTEPIDSIWSGVTQPPVIEYTTDCYYVLVPDSSGSGPTAESKADRQRRINRERLRETAGERRREQRALARAGRVA